MFINISRINTISRLGLIVFSAVVLGVLNIRLALCDTSAANSPKENGTEDLIAKLKTDLFNSERKYDNKKRPVLHYRDAIEISFYLVILHIYNLDENTGALQVSGWTEVTWLDAHLKWNVSDYGGIDFLDIPDRMIWRPDMAFINAVEQGPMLSEASRTQVYLTNDGRVTWMPPFYSRTSCELDHSSFPFDQQACRIQVGSWAYPATMLMLKRPYENHPEEALLKTFFVENALWEFVSETCITRNVSFECCPEDPYTMQDTLLVLRRRSPFYKFLYVIPSVMAMLLTLVLFWVPITATSGEKFTLGAVVIVLQMALLLALGATIPKGGKYVPRIVLFCGNSLIMSTFSMIISVGVLRMTRMTSYTPLPAAIKNILAGPVGRVLFIGAGSFQADTNSVLNAHKLENETGENHGSNMAVKPSAFCDWLLLATALDHLCFFVYTFVFAILLVACFAV